MVIKKDHFLKNKIFPIPIPYTAGKSLDDILRHTEFMQFCRWVILTDETIL